jgi:hypothetical protein
MTKAETHFDTRTAKITTECDQQSSPSSRERSRNHPAMSSTSELFSRTLMNMRCSHHRDHRTTRWHHATLHHHATVSRHHHHIPHGLPKRLPLGGDQPNLHKHHRSHSRPRRPWRKEYSGRSKRSHRLPHHGGNRCGSLPRRPWMPRMDRGTQALMHAMMHVMMHTHSASHGTSQLPGVTRRRHLGKPVTEDHKGRWKTHGTKT